MKEKIEWYKEVLELEPGSRIFFPLAKLLAEDGQIEDAVTTLRQGLSRHPDHVEARLMLVELLSQQQSMGAVRREVDDLSSLFSGYPGFWQAWSKQLAKNPDMQDASVAMRFFSESMHGRKLDWTAVIEAGLKALLLDGGDPVTKSDPESNIKASSGKDVQSNASLEHAGFDSEEESESSSQGQTTDDGASPSAGPLRVVSAKLKRPPQKKAAARDSGSAQEASPRDENGEEAFSLRTRTMADILAEQGDFEAAAEIYQELADKASGDDKAILLARFEELQTRAGETPVPVPAHDDDDDETGLDTAESSRLVDLLESLAERLEERSR